MTIAKLQDEGLCFKCRKPGHIGRDCSGSHSVKPPFLQANAMAFSKAEAMLSALDEGNQMSLFSVGLTYANMKGLSDSGSYLAGLLSVLSESGSGGDFLSESTPHSYSASEGAIDLPPPLESLIVPELPAPPKWADVPNDWFS